jgi:hypothetical protein
LAIDKTSAAVERVSKRNSKELQQQGAMHNSPQSAPPEIGIL